MASSKRKGAPSSRASPPKRRKRGSTRATAQQRYRYTEPSDSEDTTEGPEFKADCILQERRRNKILQYLVKWDCVDPKTGNIYDPEWVDAKGANELLVASWKQEKAKRRRQTAESASQTSTSGSTASARGKAQARTQHADTEAEAHSPTPHPPRVANKSRRAPVVESSPEPDTSRSSFDSSAPSTPARAARPSESATRISPRVRVVPRGDSFEPGDFDAYSQLPDTQTQTQESNLDSSQLFAVSRNNLSPGIVPDSQSSAGEASYVLTTQATGTQLQSTGTSGEHEDVEEEDSGLLDIDRETSRSPSPALSIPETIEGTECVEDEQSQREIAGLELEREVPDTIEIGEDTEQAVHTSVEEELQENGIESVLSSAEGAPKPVVQPESQWQAEDTTTQEDIVRAENEAVKVRLDVSSKTAVHLESQVEIDNTTALDHSELLDSTAEVAPPDEESTSQDVVQLQDQHQGHANIPLEHPVQVDHIQSLPQFAQKVTSQAVVPADSQEEDDCSTQEETLLESVEVVVDAAQEVAFQRQESETSESITQDENQVLVAESQVSPHESFIGVDIGPAQVKQLVGTNKQSNTREPRNTVVEAHGPQPSQTIGRDSQSTEQSVTQDVSQFPFHSQLPLHDLRSQQSKNILPTDKLGISWERKVASRTAIAETSARLKDAFVHGHKSAIDPLDSRSLHQSLVQRPLKPENRLDDLLSGLPQSEHVRGQSPSSIQNRLESAAQTVNALQVVSEEVAEPSQPPRSTGQSTQAREQNAQIVPTGIYLGTQEDTTDSLARSRSSSRHDSSQETPERCLKSVELSSSPIPHPPGHSLNTFESNVPPRFTTPAPTSSVSTMENQDASKSVEQRLKQILDKKHADKPFIPSRRSIARPTASPASTPRPVSAILEGTRSPSIVPDRAPVPQVQTSLRTVVFANNGEIPAEESETTTQLEPILTPRLEQPTNVLPDQATTSTHEGTALIDAVTDKDVPPQDLLVPEHEHNIIQGFAAPLDPSAGMQTDDEELSDADDNESLLNDDLSLGREEYIVPLFIKNRQRGMYVEHMKLKKDLVDGFLKDPLDFEPFSEIVGVLDHLKSVETHIDLVFAEAESTDAYSATQVEHAAQFGLNNSIKFSFLHTLFYELRDHGKHVVLVIEQNNDALFSIIETFCKAKFIGYRMPTKGKQANPANIVGDLKVTVLSSGDSPIIRVADLIVCLDGVQQAEQIRQKSWSAAPDSGSGSGLAPIIHLVIPRTVGHIERYISSTLDARIRVHTILASLAQMREEVGTPIDNDTPRAPIAATQVAEWLIAENNDRGLHWPLPSIGSVKDVIEFQTQVSQASTTESTADSTTESPAPERLKRPLDDEELDPVKRMRFTPQPPHAMPSSIVGLGNEITHVSDSMPGTAVDEVSRLREELARIEDAHKQERAAARKAEEQRFREHEALWDNRQTVYEDQTRDYRALLSTSKTKDTKLETANKTIETLRERLATRTTESQAFSARLEEQLNLSLLNEDERISKFARQDKDLAQACLDRDRALKSSQSTDALHEYTKEQYRLAQDAASSASARITALESENAKLARQASSETTRLRQLHLDHRGRDLEQQLKSEKAANSNLKRILAQKEDEISRLRSSGAGRMGVGTRASSATPQPTKTRSRAASPLGGRLSSLRNG
ncbi:hypothetical protein P153DRAFT_370236 [Dothidotthia symphoricarpi CBS 119687]|uniref:Chromo domain-containing protein n=1 Tax=Dothidotthia symphoricarpi CBS 119687 TaxID=1392245 RepID=A0A6A6A234_9PLEO|nr:uncharacterized protein P153DRAFT_370236 [Dothidotthia symphoricarpi CBS 119687]KAF2125596.1 hypothetical protein P153DRAFT_370236 [Dothidotthia symphoricarpi CBS 119687]